MQTKPNLKTEQFPALVADTALKTISTEDFAALGADKIVYAHTVSGADLNDWFPDALSAPADGHFHLLMSAGGVPVLVSDSDDSIADWLEQHEAVLVQRH